MPLPAAAPCDARSIIGHVGGPEIKPAEAISSFVFLWRGMFLALAWPIHFAPSFPIDAWKDYVASVDYFRTEFDRIRPPCSGGCPHCLDSSRWRSERDSFNSFTPR